MDLEERLRLITLPPTEEVITQEELREMLSTNKKIVAYDGFEPSGMLNLGNGILRAIKIQDFLDAGVDFTFYLADWFAYLNNKMGGDIELIRKLGQYFIEGWKACGVDTNRIKLVWNSDLIKDPEYWELFLRISKEITVNRVMRAVTIMGREEGAVKNPSMIVYPMMQVTDVFMLNDKKGVDICQLGMDQRKANMLAREIAPQLGRKKPVAVHHHLLLGLEGGARMGKYDENEKLNKEISSKMSKSKPSSAIFIHDSEEEINRKIMGAYCPPGEGENPILEFAKYIIFRKYDSMEIKKEEKFGGSIEVQSYEELKANYSSGRIHPLDLKNAVAHYINEIVAPVRAHFERNEKAKSLYDIARSAQVTR